MLANAISSSADNATGQLVQQLELAERNFVAGNLSAARTALEAALALAPDDPTVILAYSNILLRLEDVEGATREFLKAMTVALAAAHLNLAGVLLRHVLKDDGEAPLRRVFTIKPASPTALRLLGQLCLDQKHDADAVHDDPALLRVEPNDIETLLAFGRLYAEKRATERAQPLLERVLQLDPRNASAREALARLTKPTVPAHVLNGEQRVSQSDFSGALAALLGALQAAPNDPWLYVALGKVWLQMGNVGDGHAQLGYSLALAPDDAQAQASLAAVLCFEQEFEAAERQARRALELDPDSDEAIAIWREARRHFPPAAAPVAETPAARAALAVDPRFAEEILFWDKELSLTGIFTHDILQRLSPEGCRELFSAQLLPLLEERRQALGRRPRVLDCGAGPLSMLAWGERHELCDIIATDPLAEVYVELLERYGHKPTTALVRCFGEDLIETFGRESFDLVWMRNALDHSQSPERVFQGMAEALRPGGYLLISGYTCEATREGWIGLHQHDLYMTEGGRLMCRSRQPDGAMCETCLSDGLELMLVECSPPSDLPAAWMFGTWQRPAL